MKLKRGFTLAEVLVTLAVIALIATITLPALWGSAPNKEQIMLKKAYYLLSRNVNEMINDEDLYPERDDERLSGFSNTDIHDQTADGRQAKFHGQEYPGDRTKFCHLMAARMNIRGQVTCNAARTLDQGGNFETADGIIWSIPITDFNRGGANVNAEVQVDVSGRSGRNCFEGGNCTIPDRFRILVDRYGRITVPQNGIEQEYLTRSTTNVSYSDIRKGYRR